MSFLWLIILHAKWNIVSIADSHLIQIATRSCKNKIQTANSSLTLRRMYWLILTLWNIYSILEWKQKSEFKSWGRGQRPAWGMAKDKIKHNHLVWAAFGVCESQSWALSYLWQISILWIRLCIFRSLPGLRNHGQLPSLHCICIVLGIQCELTSGPHLNRMWQGDLPQGQWGLGSDFRGAKCSGSLNKIRERPLRRFEDFLVMGMCPSSLSIAVIKTMTTFSLGR